MRIQEVNCARAHTEDTQDAQIVNVNGIKTATKIKRVLHLLAHIYGCKCPKRQKAIHTSICQQKLMNTALFGDVYKTHDTTPHQQSISDIPEEIEEEETDTSSTTIETLDEDPNTSRPTSPHSPFSEGEAPEPFYFRSGTPSPIPRHPTPPVPDGSADRSSPDLPGPDPSSETIEVLPDTSDTSVSLEFRTADSIEQFDATIEFITEQLENIVAQRDHELRKAVTPEEVGQIVSRTQAQALQLRSHILLLQEQKKTLFDPTHSSSPAPRKPLSLLQQIDQLLFDKPHTRKKGPPPFGLLPPKPKPPPKPPKL